MAALVQNVVQRLNDVLALTDSLLTIEKAKIAVIKQEANNAFMVSNSCPADQNPFKLLYQLPFISLHSPCMQAAPPAPLSIFQRLT